MSMLIYKTGHVYLNAHAERVQCIRFNTAASTPARHPPAQLDASLLSRSTQQLNQLPGISIQLGAAPFDFTFAVGEFFSLLKLKFNN